MPSRFAPSQRARNGENDASAGELVNSLLSSYGALPGGSNPQRKECEAAINQNTPFSYYLCGCGGLELFLPWRADVRNEPWIGRAIMLQHDLVGLGAQPGDAVGDAERGGLARQRSAPFSRS